MRAEIKKIHEMMESADYVTDPAIATSVHLAMTLKKPLLIEGHAGVGKTEIAKVMAKMLGTSLIRLQCYEGLDAAQALYEWNYPKQLLHIKLEESTPHTMSEKEVRILTRKVPGVNERLAKEISRFMETTRTLRLSKVPGIAETLDWAQALSSLHADHLDETLVAETLGCVVKDVDDIQRLKRELATCGIGRFVAAQR